MIVNRVLLIDSLVPFLFSNKNHRISQYFGDLSTIKSQRTLIPKIIFRTVKSSDQRASLLISFALIQISCANGASTCTISVLMLAINPALQSEHSEPWLEFELLLRKNDRHAESSRGGHVGVFIHCEYCNIILIS